MGDAAMSEIFPIPLFPPARPDRRKRGVTSLLLSALRESCCPPSFTHKQSPPLFFPQRRILCQKLCVTQAILPLLLRLEDQAIPSPPHPDSLLSPPSFSPEKKEEEEGGK